jgi:hypothetical protein
MKIKELGEETNEYKWQICFNGRLAGVRNDGKVIKVTK